MHILSSRFYAGPNRHTLSSAFEAIVDLKGYDAPTSSRPTFVEALTEEFPGLHHHHCSRGRIGGLVQRLHEGTYLGHVTEHVALELLYLGGEHGVYGKTRDIDDAGRTVRIIFECETEPGGLYALEQAIAVVTTLWDGGRVDGKALGEEARIKLASWRLGPSTRAIVEEAMARGIPVARLDDGNLVRLGQGVRQRRLMATTTDRTSLYAVELAQNKESTKRVLESAGIPVPKGRVVKTPAEAWEAALALGLPVVLKPQEGHHGSGVSMHLTTKSQVLAAYKTAAVQGSVLVEPEVAGVAYRALVVGQDMVAVTQRVPPSVEGDGVRTVRQLIAELNRDPRRGPGHGFIMTWVPSDAETELCLAQQGYRLDDVPKARERVWVRTTANMSTGAEARDVTQEVSHELARDMVRSAQAIGLDLAGVDFVAPRLDEGLQSVGGAVIEVNAAPGLRMHLWPSEGSPAPVAEKIVDYLFGQSQGRIPVAAITGTNGKTTVTRMLGHIWSEQGARVGMSTTDGISVGEAVVKKGDLTGPWSARLLLNDPSVEVAVLETARGGMARGGLGFDDCDLAVVTNIGLDHLGQDDVMTLDDLVHLKALIVDVVRPDGAAVLNADDPLVLAMASRCRGQVILFSTNPGNEEIHRWVAEGRTAVYLKRGHLYYAHNFRETRIIGARVLPASLGGVAQINVSNAAAAAAAALAMGAELRVVARALASFPLGEGGLNRGRLEMLSGPDVRVLVDYGHNTPALHALGDICRQLKAQEIVTVLGLPGDRRDEDILQAAHTVGGFSHRVVIREDADLRGRKPGELARLMDQALSSTGSLREIVLDEAEAVKRAILEARPGALVLILYERYQTVRKAAEKALLERHGGIPKRESDTLSHV